MSLGLATVSLTFPYLGSIGAELRFITSGVKAGPLFYRPPLSVMYSHSQRGICSVAPLTLPSRELSRACVYLPLFVLRSPRPCRENTSGGRKGTRVTWSSMDDQFRTHAATRPFSVPKRNEWAEWLLTAALSHPMTCEEALRFAQWWSRAPEIKSQGPHKVWQKNTRRRRPLLSH